jgi:hypothetical protein
MLLNHFSFETYAKEHQRELLEEARRSSLARAASPRRRPKSSTARPALFAPVLARIGRALVAAGRGLESRAARPTGLVSCVICAEETPSRP